MADRQHAWLRVSLDVEASSDAAVSEQRPSLPLSTQLLRATAGILFLVYVAWNAWWLAHGEIPLSLFKAFTGLPCPTTGGTRAIVALLNGDWWQSLRWNAFAVPILALTVASIFEVVRQRVRYGRFRLPVGFGWLWAILLTAAWLTKLLSPSIYW